MNNYLLYAIEKTWNNVFKIISLLKIKSSKKNFSEVIKQEYFEHLQLIYDNLVT